MKEYPSIPSYKDSQIDYCIGFNKEDGSNLRWEFRKKKGFVKQGTRTRLFDKSDPDFGSAISIFNEKFSDPLSKLFTDDAYFRQQQEITVFTEFFGPHSFAGQHLQNDPKELIMFDVWIYKYGLMSPREFIKTFIGLVPTAKVIYEGKCDHQFIQDVKIGKYADQGVFEGVICKAGKGGHGKNLLMCKIKTDAYLDKLKAVFFDRWQNFWE